jgi:hypothetical protein
MNCIIYKIYSKLDENTIYIGRTTHTMSHRLSNHIKAAKSGKDKSPKSRWISFHIKNGEDVYVEKLEEFNTSEFGIREREDYWISWHRSRGFNLLNEGIDAVHNGQKISEKQRKQLKKSTKNTWKTKRIKKQINFQEFFSDAISGMSHSDLGKKYDISVTHVKNIISGKSRGGETEHLRRIKC